MKKIVLSTICPTGYSRKSIQLALYYLKAYFNKYSALSDPLEIEIMTFLAQEKVKDIAKRIIRTRPVILGFSCYVWNVTNILKLCKLVKKVLPEVKILLGGPEVSPRSCQILRDEKCIDLVVIGEGEKTFKEVVESLISGKNNLSAIDGIAYRTEKRAVLNKKRLSIANLDTIPSPYLEGLVNIKNFSSIPTETHRGCVFKCHYCYYHKEFKELRFFSLERIERELGFILGKRPKEVYLMDPTFNINRKMAKDILRIFIKHNKKTKLHLELKAELLDEETVELLRKANISFLEIGIQSTNPKTLNLINRHFNPTTFKKGILLLNKRKIYSQIQLIDSLPRDNYETLKQSVDWLYALRPSEVRIMRLMLLPGTYLREHAKRFKITYEPEPQYHSFKSDTFSHLDLTKTTRLRVAMGALYRRGLLRESLYVLAEKLSIKFSKIFEEWIAWAKIKGRRMPRRKRLSKVAAQRQRTISVLGQLNSAKHFVKYLYNKYHESDGDNIPEELKKTLSRDKSNFLKKNRIKLEKV